MGRNVWDQMPSAGLEVDVTGEPIQNTACGDNDWIIARAAADGVIATAGGEIIVSSAGSHLPPDDAINVKGCPNILLLIAGTAGGGVLYIYPKFAMTRGGTYYQNNVPDFGGAGGANLRANAIAAYSLNGVQIAALAVVSSIIQVMNPGANWMKIAAQQLVSDSGTGFDISVARGFCPVSAI